MFVTSSPTLPPSRSLPASSLFLHRCSLPPLDPLHCSTNIWKEVAKRIKEEERIKEMCKIGISPTFSLRILMGTLGEAWALLYIRFEVAWGMVYMEGFGMQG